MPVLKADQLRTLGASIFTGLGAPEDDAKLVTDLLVDANLTGFDSHGMIRLPIYARGVKMGAVKPGAEVRIVSETPSTAVIDGGWNFGQVVAKYAMNVCIEKARNCVVGLVTARNSQHAGRMNTYAEMAMAQDMIGIASVNSASYVAPFGGKSKQLGTNPLCFAIPSGEESPMILDMATSVWARGKVMVHMARGEKLPEGIFMDPEGNPTTDPDWYTKGGVLRNLGGEIAGYKGFGLSLLVEMLTGALTEGGVSNSEEYRSRPFYGGNGIFMMAIDVGQITDLDAFKKRVDGLLRTVKDSPTAPGYDEILIPGEPERRMKEKRIREGIFIEDKTWDPIVALAKELGIKIPV
ncbi:MAG: Ldh family oxidoreductase [Candidatus Bathyarchaeota archaeon]|nr:Ldh family oxidoreductase [Candidatus Bathyarchaeota archaeon]